jgi:hypothetical protein
MKMQDNRDLNPNKYPLRSHRSLRNPHRVAVLLSAAFWLALVPFVSAQTQPPPCIPCGPTPDPNTPLNDLGDEEYIAGDGSHNQGGLYLSGFNQRPPTYNQQGINLTSGPDGVTPRNKDTGLQDLNNGKIVMISIGMCNSSMEFGGTLSDTTAEEGFQCRVTGTKHPDNTGCLKASCGLVAANWKNPKLFVWDGAQSGKDAKQWADALPGAGPWAELDCRLTGAQLSKKQVQVVWLKEALAEPRTQYGPWPIHVQALQQYLATILTHLVDPAYGFVDSNNTPTVKMVFLSPRSHAWTQGLSNPCSAHSPEPEAYETGFADKWIIAGRIKGLTPVNWPWISWGPYIWADGDVARSDGLTWPAINLRPDCIHPLNAGVHNVADQLLAFFRTDPVARPWFLKSPTSQFNVNVTTTCDPTNCTINEDDSVTFTASVGPGRTITEWVWTYDDGCFATGQPVVTKTFPAPSDPANPYKVHVTAIDSNGNAGFKDITIQVNASQAGGGSLIDTKHPTATLGGPKGGAGPKIAVFSTFRNIIQQPMDSQPMILIAEE